MATRDELHEQWQQGVSKALGRGKAPEDQLSGQEAEERLIRQIEDYQIRGLYHDDEPDRGHGVVGAMPFVRGAKADPTAGYWNVCALHDTPDVAETKEAMQADLLAGVESVWLRFDPDGLPIDSADELLGLMGSKFASQVTMCSSVMHPGELAKVAVQHASERHATFIAGLDPYRTALHHDADIDLEPVRTLIETDDEHLRAVALDGHDVHEAGAYVSTTLGMLVAEGADLMRRLIDAGIDKDTAWKHITFRVPVDQDQFLSMASLRALRWCWATVGEALGVSEELRGAHIHAVTSRRMLTTIDAYNNLLRNTVAAFAAGLGGAQEVTVRPFDDREGLPLSFSRRMARNTQNLLLRESHVGQVIDPAGGSTYVENLTEQVAEATWSLFQQIEAAGGAHTFATTGALQTLITEQAARRAKDIATRKRPLTGVTEFAPLKDVETPRKERDGELGNPFGAQFDSAAIEELRERGVALGGEEPHKVPVVTIGAYKEHSPRLGFVTSVLAIAGLEALPIQLNNDGTVDESLLKGSPVVFVAGAPKGYAEQGEAATKAVRSGDSTVKVVGAGREKEFTGDDMPDEFIGMGVDIYDFLVRTVDAMEKRA